MKTHICPFWVGYLLASPLRRLRHDPKRIVGSYVKTGMTVLDVGSAMGFFSIPMAKMVGPDGHVVCVEVQSKMLDSLLRRAARAHLTERVETHICPSDTLELSARNGTFDFALAFAVLHEVPNQTNCLTEIHDLLKNGGVLLFAEPKKRVGAEQFDRSLKAAQNVGFVTGERPTIRGCYAAVFTKPLRNR